MINIFYQEPEEDRWIAFDRYPRKIIRRIVRGRPRPGGHTRVFLNLKAGLQKAGVPFRENDFGYARRHPEEPVGIIGKPHVIDMMEWKNPILFGAAVMSHPIDDPSLFLRRPVRKVLVPGEWMRKMCEPFWGDKVAAWPVGIDTDRWRASPEIKKEYDYLIYDKVRWDHDRYEKELIEPIREELRKQSLKFSEIRYGYYQEEEFHEAVKKTKAMIFLCEHETQGIAYQQALAMNVPILAWDRGGPWRDPSYYPDRVEFKPVTSVPYWDEKCGEKFTSLGQFSEQREKIEENIQKNKYQPRAFIIKHLSLERCAKSYVEHLSSIR